MSRPRVAWYVHHHGRGHVGRLLAIAPHLDADILCFSSLPRPDGLPENCEWVHLERDDAVEPGAPPAERDPSAGGLLHWAPLLHDGHRRRLTAIAATIDRRAVAAFVVDVSAEVTLFARLLGIPPVLITQPGQRDDDTHLLAFRAAAAIIAPWPEELLRPRHLGAFPQVAYVGGISRFDGRTAPSDHRSGVLVLSGAGGTTVTAEALDAAVAATHGQSWSSVGPLGGGVWSADPWEQLGRADVVVAWAGQNSVADLAAAGSRAVIIPQGRPFGEQDATADALEHAGLAVVERGWPAADRWHDVLGRARALRPEWSRWRTSGAAARAARAIEDVANTRWP